MFTHHQFVIQTMHYSYGFQNAKLAEKFYLFIKFVFETETVATVSDLINLCQDHSINFKSKFKLLFVPYSFTHKKSHVYMCMPVRQSVS